MASSDATQVSLEHIEQGSALSHGKVVPNFDDLHLSIRAPVRVDLEEERAYEEVARKGKLEMDEYTRGSSLQSLGSERYLGKFKDIIGSKLAKRMAVNSALRHSVITALRKIEFVTGKEDIVKAVSETDPENPDWIQNLIKVQIDTQDLVEWKQKKKQIERIAIDCRAGNIRLHTLVEREDNTADVD